MKNACDADVSAKLAPLCVGKPFFNLTGVSVANTLGPPCKGANTNTQLIVRIGCSAKLPPAAAPSGAQALPRIAAVVNATVPGGSVGEVHVPLAHLITEGDRPVYRDGKAVQPGVAGVKVVGCDGRFVIFATGAGSYSFASE